MIRMIVSDLDKTLIGTSGRLTDFTADVICKSQNAGIRWVLATGRGFETVDPVLKAGKVTMDLILLNGAQYISFDGKTQYYEALDPLLCRKLISFLCERKIDIEQIPLQEIMRLLPEFWMILQIFFLFPPIAKTQPV